MNNVFHTHMKIDKRYDLKGSTQGREVAVKDGELSDPTIALKDLDFLKAKEKFKIEGDIKKRLLETIKKDVTFFAECEIIDYSLLVGIHQKNLH
jgi:1-phosphatidylinositol-4-phosphate 5-kinase